jgi:hypothetical protein
VIPRLGTLAGLELGTGVIAVAQGPREVASRLRGQRTGAASRGMPATR